MFSILRYIYFSNFIRFLLSF
ncbi:hypothetical protein ACJIZ3_014490 [Penstemon smallii]|uniref:Uncharacterized protein n=1 Tax=Penstemon smallii TaxID=265156 RepID=A0ABD3RJQ0_9LAMI